MSPLEVPLVVDGDALAPGAWIERENPARTQERVGRVAAADPAVAARAVEAAAAASPAWREVPVAERAERLVGALQRAIGDRAEELARLLTRELGKVLVDTRGELRFAQAWTSFCATASRAVCAERELDDAEGRLLVRPEPFGVVAAITPWNAPIILAMLKVAPALVTGNTMVVKPSPLAPLAVTELLGALGRELPRGVLNVVNGGPDVGRVLVEHRAVSKIAFTGGLPTARAIMAGASRRVTPLVLELGGNDPAIFLEDAELTPATLERAVFGTFLTSGQVCMAIKRLYVHGAIAVAFREGYEAAAARCLVVGDPLDEEVTVGPLVSADQARRVEGLVREARAHGAAVRELGRVAGGASLSSGHFLRPTLVTGVPDDARVVAEEQFGPTVPLLTFRDEEEALRRAGEGELALASSVWSADEDRAFRLAGRLLTGFTFVNTHNRSGLALRAPFGGRGASGFGREFGEEGLREYVQTHAINLPAAVRAGAGGRSYPSG